MPLPLNGFDVFTVSPQFVPFSLIESHALAIPPESVLRGNGLHALPLFLS